jgi:transketolase
LIATGSEVELALKAAEALTACGRNVSVVSMPSVDVFLAQDATYRETVLPNAVRARVAVEAGHKDFWYRFVGLDGAVVGMDRFGESAPADQLYQYFGITVDTIIAAVETVLA